MLAKYSGGNILATGIMPFCGLRRPCRCTTTIPTQADNSLLRTTKPYTTLIFQHDVHLGNRRTLYGVLATARFRTQWLQLTVSLQPNHSPLNQYSGFVQDEVSLFDKRLRVTLGSKVRAYDFTGLKWNPNVRFVGILSKNQSVWAAISRASGPLR